MKNAKQYTLLALGAFVGFNVANNVQASTNDTQERQYGHGYYGHPHDQSGHPQYERRRMQQTSPPKLSKESSRDDGHGWGRSGHPHNQPGHPQYQSNTSRTQQAPNIKDESRYGYGYYGHPHEQPGHPLYKPQISTERTQKMRMPRGYGQPTQQPEISEVVSEQLPDYEKATEQSVDVQPSAPEMPSTTAD